MPNKADLQQKWALASNQLQDAYDDFIISMYEVLFSLKRFASITL